MPKGPQGQKRPADAIGAAVMVARIATGEIEDNQKSGRVRSGKAGAKARTAARRFSKYYVLIAATVLLLSFGVMLFDFALGSVLGMPAFAYLLAMTKDKRVER